MALIPPQPIGILPGSGLWNDWIEKIRTAVNNTLSSINWSIIIGKPTTVAGFGITDAVTTSTTLDANRLILGNGSHDVIDMASLGTSTTVLHGNAAGAPTFSAVVLTTDVSGVLPVANGGTGQATPSGVYTPTLTNVANLDASTAYQCQYLRLNDFVIVTGKVDIDPTLTATSTELGISLPIASNLGATEDCAGVAFAATIAAQGAAILGDATNNRAQMQWISGDTTNQSMYFTFSYQII